MIVQVQRGYRLQDRNLSDVVEDCLRAPSLDDPDYETFGTLAQIRAFCGALADALVTRGHLDLADVIRALPSGHGIVESEGS